MTVLSGFFFDVLTSLYSAQSTFSFLPVRNDQLAGVKLCGVLLQFRGRVSRGIDCDRNEKDVLAETLADRFLNSFEVAADGRTDVRAAREEHIDDDRLSLEHIAVKLQLASILVQQLDVAEILRGRRQLLTGNWRMIAVRIGWRRWFRRRF